jgi:hypothetical protein
MARQRIPRLEWVLLSELAMAATRMMVVVVAVKETPLVVAAVVVVAAVMATRWTCPDACEQAALCGQTAE